MKKISINMSDFELLLRKLDFEGHSQSKYWDYDDYGHVKDKMLTTALWLQLIRAGYIAFEHVNWIDLPGALESFEVLK